MNFQPDKSVPYSNSWIEKNIDKMMGEVARDAKNQRSLPLSISFHGVALQKFVEILKSKKAFFPGPDGSFTFLTVPIQANNRLPYGTFIVNRFKEAPLLRR